MLGAARTFGELLREFRVRAGLSQSDLAEKASISEDAVGALERAVRKVPYRATVASLARALELTTHESEMLEAARVAARSKAAPNAIRHNIEAERSSFVGREADLQHILKLLRRSRLVSVTGAGGVGKTRAALEAARLVQADRFNEVWFIDLAPLSDGDSIPGKIASALKPQVSGGSESIVALASALKARNMLLILDNSEHLVSDVARAVDTILEVCAHVTVLVTGRERINIAGEFVYALPPLEEQDAEELFIQRAEATGRQFDVDRDRPAIRALVARLEGIPLAIELAAAQLPALGLAALKKRLDAHFSLPPARRDLPARQQTVEATIRWSYDLLTDEERELLRGISIFAGGFTLEAAESVCSSDLLDASSVLSGLSSLVNKSLVNATQLGDETRYSMLDSVLYFARARLAEAGKEIALRRRHAEWFASMADDIIEHWTERPSYDVTTGHSGDLDNVRSAVAWALEASSPDDRALGGRILIGLYQLWDEARLQGQQRVLIETALERVDEAIHPEVVAGLLHTFIVRVHWERATLIAIDRVVPLAERIGDRRRLAELHTLLVSAYAWHEMYAEAERSLVRAKAMLAQAYPRDSRLRAHLLRHEAILRIREGRLEDARAAVDEAESIAMVHGDRYFVVIYCWDQRCHIECQAGNLRKALAIAQDMLASEYGTTVDVLNDALLTVAGLRLQLGEADEAVDSVRQLLVRARDGHYVLPACDYAALALALRGRAVQAATLLGFLRAAEGRLKKVRQGPVRRGARELLVSTLARQLPEEQRRSADADGAQLTPERAVDLALAALELEPS